MFVAQLLKFHNERRILKAKESEEILRLRNNIAELERELGDLKFDFSWAEVELQALQKKIEMEKCEKLKIAEEMRKEADELRKEIEARESHIGTLKFDCAWSEALVQVQNKKIRSLSEENDRLQNEKNKINHEFLKSKEEAEAELAQSRMESQLKEDVMKNQADEINYLKAQMGFLQRQDNTSILQNLQKNTPGYGLKPNDFQKSRSPFSAIKESLKLKSISEDEEFPPLSKENRQPTGFELFQGEWILSELLNNGEPEDLQNNSEILKIKLCGRAMELSFYTNGELTRQLMATTDYQQCEEWRGKGRLSIFVHLSSPTHFTGGHFEWNIHDDRLICESKNKKYTRIRMAKNHS